MEDLSRLLGKLGYRELARICGEEELKKSGKKIDLVKRLTEVVPEEKLRTYVMEFLGVGKKILEHDWVPKHRIMKPEEIEKLMVVQGIKKNQLPKVLDSDSVSMLLGARPGDVLEIIRVRETSGENKYYRVVVRSLRD